MIHLKEALNGGLLPDGYYALSEQHAGARIAAVLTLQAPESEFEAGRSGGSGALALADAPPRVARKIVADEWSAYRLARRTLVVRHVHGHRIVALVEILSAGNKDRAATVAEFVEKVRDAQRMGCHVLVIDLFPAGPHDPRGIHEAIWEEFGEPSDGPASAGERVLVSYLATKMPEAYLQEAILNAELPEMPLFIDIGLYVPAPLELTYMQAYRGMPAYWRGVIEAA
jgi:hypothetical protein